MKLIDRYIEQVGEYLPARDREDIQKEIRSILEDTLENRGAEEGRPVDEAMTVDVLKEFGSPKKVAASYLPPRYLIGPRLYPTFLMVIKLVLGIMGLVVIVTTAVSLSQQPFNMDAAVEFIIKKFMELIGSMLSVFGNVVFVFAIVEWVMGQARPENETAWDPRSLDEETASEEVKPWSQVPDIVLIILALLIFNVFAGQFGANITDSAGKSVFVPAIAPVFYSYLPWLNLLWVLGLGLNIALIRAGKWQTWSKWFQMGLDVLFIVLLIVMASGPSIILEAGDRIAALGAAGEQIANIYLGIGIGIKILLIVLIVVTAVELVTGLIKLVRRKGFPGNI